MSRDQTSFTRSITTVNRSVVKEKIKVTGVFFNAHIGLAMSKAVCVCLNDSSDQVLEGNFSPFLSLVSATIRSLTPERSFM